MTFLAARIMFNLTSIYISSAKSDCTNGPLMWYRALILEFAEIAIASARVYDRYE